MSNHRGNAPSELTKKILIARAAGRCQLCNEFVLTDSFTMTDDNNSNMAHIIASSPDGPRGDDQLSHEMSDKIENLMLMCTKHHHLIDQHPEIYTVEVLKDMKKHQEDRVRKLCESMKVSTSEHVIFQSKIKGEINVAVNNRNAVQSLVQQYQPLNNEGILIDISINKEYKDPNYWEEACKTIDYSFEKVKTSLHYNPNVIFSVFPIAPIPMIIKLGYLFNDKIPVEVYQKFRNPDTWIWLSEESTNTFEFKKEKLSEGNQIAVIISLTSEIDISRVQEAYKADIIYTLFSDRQDVDSIKSKEDLSAFWHTYLKLFDNIKNSYPSIHKVALFPAIPASAAFEIGHHYMQRVYPAIQIYDDDQGFFKTITIGDNNEQ